MPRETDRNSKTKKSILSWGAFFLLCETESKNGINFKTCMLVGFSHNTLGVKNVKIISELTFRTIISQFKIVETLYYVVITTI